MVDDMSNDFDVAMMYMNVMGMKGKEWIKTKE